MRREDMRAGTIVAVNPHGNASLGSPSVRRAIVLGEGFFTGPLVRIWWNRYDHALDTGGYAGAWHRVESDSSARARHNAGYALALEHVHFHRDPDGAPLRTSTTWELVALQGRNVAGLWSDHLRVQSERQAEEKARREAHRAHQDTLEAWADSWGERLIALTPGLHVSPHRSYVELSHERLERLIELAEAGLKAQAE